MVVGGKHRRGCFKLEIKEKMLYLLRLLPALDARDLNLSLADV